MEAKTRYRDTREDAIKMIVDEAEGVFDVSGAEAEMDPVVEGCWLVTIGDLARGQARRRFLVYTDNHFDGAGWEEVEA